MITYEDNILRNVVAVNQHMIESAQFSMVNHIESRLERELLDKIATMTPCMVGRIRHKLDYDKDLGTIKTAEVQVVRIT